VTLEVCNEAGCTTRTKTITVLDPTPRILDAQAAPGVSEIGQLVHLVGSGSGMPPLTFTWRIVSGGTTRTLTGPEVWWDTRGEAPGTYVVTLEIGNPVAPGVVPAATLLQPLEVTLVPETDAEFHTVAPCRVVDTRPAALVGGERRDFSFGGACGVPPEARAVAANVTAVAVGGGGYVTLFPGNYPMPSTSVVNFSAGQVRANFAVLPLATDGSGLLSAVATVTGGGTVDLVIDVAGYFLPTPPAPAP
jgi:hypothetical protein